LISSDIPGNLPSSLSQFVDVEIDTSSLLGFPLSPAEATDAALKARLASLKSAASRLHYLQKHDALVILKYSLILPSLQYNRRSSCCVDHHVLQEFDTALRECLLELLNVSLGEEQWAQATLPMREGGLGLRRACQIAPLACLASASGSSDLITAVLPSRHAGLVDPPFDIALSAWSQKQEERLLPQVYQQKSSAIGMHQSEHHLETGFLVLLSSSTLACVCWQLRHLDLETGSMRPHLQQ
jgi:hypothetical protein